MIHQLIHHSGTLMITHSDDVTEDNVIYRGGGIYESEVQEKDAMAIES